PKTCQRSCTSAAYAGTTTSTQKCLHKQASEKRHLSQCLNRSDTGFEHTAEITASNLAALFRSESLLEHLANNRVHHALRLVGCVASTEFRTNSMFYGFAEAADWRAFQHFDQIRETLENRRCNTSLLIEVPNALIEVPNAKLI